MGASLHLVLGGARSGKSRFGEQQLAAAGGGVLLVTAEALDEEMRARIEQHRCDRHADWPVIEAPHGLAQAVVQAGAGGQPLLIDCLTVWLSNRLLAGADVAAETRHLADCLAACPVPVIAVSNEVGFGLVPMTPLGRQFRDAAGWLNQALAAVAQRVTLVAAGLPLVLKQSQELSQE